MNLFLVLSLLTVGGTYFASRVPNQEDMVNSFQEAQRFYAEGAYDQAIAEYEAVAQVRSRALDAPAIQVTVGEDVFPVQEAAGYQIGNSYGKVYAEYAQQAADEPVASRRAQLTAMADSAYTATVSSFKQVISHSTNELLIIQAYGRLIDLNFEAKKYPEVIEAADALAAAFPDAPQVIVGYYNTGWALYEMKDYDGAIKAFKTLLARFPSGYQADRSLFQIGECYLETGRYELAIDTYSQLIDRQQIADLTEVELRRMQREKIAGLVDETALELAAKAQIRIGTCYSRLELYEEGLEAYRSVITLFASERKLVEEAYLRMADLHHERGDFEAGVSTYREAIDQSTNRTLRARIQYALAESYFSQARYALAVREYRTYLDGYGDIAAGAGFSQGRVRYRIGSAYQQLAESDDGDGAGSRSEWLKLAIGQYDTLCVDERSSYFLDARFNRALAHQSLGTDTAMDFAEAEFGAIVQGEDENYTQRALIQLGELHFDRGKYDRAAQASRQLLDDHPYSEYLDKAYMRLALSHQAVGDLDRAVPAFLGVAEDSPLYARARLGGGHSLLNERKYGEAAQVLEAGLARADDDVQCASFNYLLGQAYTGAGEFSQAVSRFSSAFEYPVGAELEEALRFSRGNAAFAVASYELAEEDFSWIVEHVAEPAKVRSAKDALALIYLRQNRGTEAVKTLADMAADTQSAEERATLLSRVMDLHYEEDNYAQTIAVARELIALEFADELLPGQEYRRKEKAYFLIGDALARLDRGAEAAEVFHTALERFPESVFATDMRLALGVHYFDTGDLDRAKQVFRDLSKEELDRDHSMMVRFYLANTYYSLREFTDAREAFAYLLREYPDAGALPDILFGLAESHYQLGEFQPAIGHYQQILEKYPNDSTADRSLYNMAWCMIELKREDESMVAFRRLLERYPHSEFAASAQFTLADDAYNRRSYEEAMAGYRLVQERYPDDPVAAQVPRLISEISEAVAYEHYEAALVLMDSAEAAEQGESQKEYFERAVGAFQEISERYPGTESELGALSNMGVCLEGLGQWREAVAVYDQVIGMYEDKRASKEVFQFVKAHKDWIVSTRL
jgi:TolA-binding protein